MDEALLFNVRKGIVTILLTERPASRHTTPAQPQPTKIKEEGAWLRNWQ